MKNNFYGSETSSRLSLFEWIIVVSCVLMFSGFMFSRILLSIGMISLIVLGFRPNQLRQGWERFRHCGFCWLAIFFFLSYFISGLWSQDMEGWMNFTQIKIPFLFLPFAMLNLPLQKKKLQLWVIGSILIVLLGGIIYSCSFLIRNPERLFSGSHLPSPAFGDYIRFTIAIVLAMQMVLYLLNKKYGFSFQKFGKTVLIIWLIIAAIYIHLQAAKSGLVCFYLFILINVGYHFIKKSKTGIWKAFGMIAVTGILLVLSAKFVPPVENQFSRLQKERAIWNSGDTSRFASVSSVIPRLMSYETAWKGIREHPTRGVGAGDLNNVMQRLYEEYYPFVVKNYRIIPHNQYVCSALLIGIPLTLILIIMVLWPLFIAENVMLLATTFMMIVGTMIEAMFEIQFGVFIYLFFTLFWLSAMHKEKGIPTISTI